MSIKAQIQQDIKEAMKARNKETLEVLRLISAAVKQIEVDERIEVDDTRMLVILDKLAKQRNESISHYKAAAREDLLAQELFELKIIEQYLPAPLSEAEIAEHIETAFASISVKNPSDMGQIMAYLKPRLQGRVDMGKISAQVKAKINALLG